MPLPPRTVPGKPLVPGPITIPPMPPGGTPPPLDPPHTTPPIVGGDPGNVPMPPRAKIRYGLVSVHGIGPDEVAVVCALPDNRVSASVMSASEAAAKVSALISLIAPDPTKLGRKEVAAEPEVPTFEQEVLASLSEIRHGQNVILDYVATPSTPVEPPASLPKTFWDILRSAVDSEWPSVPGAPEKPAGVSYDPLKGWRSDVIKDGMIADLSVLPVLDKSEADNVNTLCLRAWLGIGFLGLTGGDWPEHIWKRNVVREILAGNLPEIESLIPTGERDRVLWGILEGEIEIEAGFGARVHEQIQANLFPVVPDGSGKSKSFESIVSARLERLSGQVGGVPSGFNG